jgi:hypothetical protein
MMYHQGPCRARKAARPERHNTMKTAMIVKSGFTAVAFLLISTAAIAQSAPAGRTTQPTIKPRDGHSGMATGKYQRKAGAIHSADYNRSTKDSVHTTKPQAPAQETKRGENPLYESSGTAGTNPMHESNRTQGAPLKGVPPGRLGSSKSAAAVQHKKHVAGVKYEDRTAAGNGDATGAHTPSPKR